MPIAVTDFPEAFGPGTKLLPPISYRQLAVFPIIKPESRQVDAHEYLSLAAGLKEKLVAVTEAAGGAQVNAVTDRNGSSKPLLPMWSPSTSWALGSGSRASRSELAN